MINEAARPKAIPAHKPGSSRLPGISIQSSTPASKQVTISISVRSRVKRPNKATPDNSNRYSEP